MCSKLDKKCHKFIWGSTSEARKVHLVNWDDLCQPKELGGIGMRPSSSVNMACMMKVGWNFINNKDDLWVKVIRARYGCGEDLITRIARKK